MRTTLLLGAALAGCHGHEEAPPPHLLDTGWFTTPATVEPECDDQFVSWSPEDGESDWYWRDRPTFFTETSDPTKYEVYLQDEDGVRVPTTMDWDDSGLSFTLNWDGYLAADKGYTIGMTDCQAFRTVGFRTSSLGQPLATTPGDLAGNTYLLDLVHADWVEPPVLGGLIALYFTDPILMGIRYADDDSIDLLAAPGKTDEFGVVTQNLALQSWDFPLADFTGAPFLDAEAPQIELHYGDMDIPVYDFVYQATFSADATTLGGGVLSGVGDTRNLGALLYQEDNPSAVCDLAAGIGVRCDPCPTDGMPYCLHLRAEALKGELLPGLILVEDP
jgi:hypothetical protein